MPDIARRIEELDVVILQRAAEHHTIAVFPVRGGVLDEPLFLRFAEISSEPRSVEAILKEKLEPPEDLAENAAEPEPVTQAQLEQQQSLAPLDTAAFWRSRYGLRAAPPQLPEHLSLLARWFYSKPREGEILFRDKVWPYRRMLRACSRLLAGPQPTKTPPQPSQ